MVARRVPGNASWYNELMPSFRVETPQRSYDAIVERGAILRIPDVLPVSAGKVFVVTTEDVWTLHGDKVKSALGSRPHQVLFFPGGEPRKRLQEVEALAEQMMAGGGDRSSMVIAFGGGISTDVAGFLAAIFMRGIPVVQIPTTLLAQVDAAIGGKTGVNMVAGKNLIGSFHQPLAVLIDPDVLHTLSDREFRAGLYEVVKAGVIRDADLFHFLASKADRVLARDADALEHIISAAVRIKAEVVTADEREGDLRRILNFGHTIGHALEAETRYERFLHGEAVAFGIHAATTLAEKIGKLGAKDAALIHEGVARYGPIPKLDGISADNLLARLGSDKKTVRGNVHFVLPVRIGEVAIVTGVDPVVIREAIETTLAETVPA